MFPKTLSFQEVDVRNDAQVTAPGGNEEILELWTLQRVEVLTYIAKHGRLKADGRRIDHDYRRAYRWLVQEMNQRIAGYPGCYPVWAWPYKPDMRHYVHETKKAPLVRLGFRVPRHRVLLHDFQSWNVALSGGAVVLDEEEWNASETWSEQQVQATWSRIFDFDLLTSSVEWGSPYLQATLAEVRAEEIFSVRVFPHKH